MNLFERTVTQIRHNRFLENTDWLWDRLRPLYEKTLELTQRKGLKRMINGVDPVLIDPRFRQVTGEYEPAMWHSIMSRAEPGNLVVDVGAFIGLYTVALARRVGLGGRVIAIEPDPENFAGLVRHVKLNGVGGQTQCVQKAVGRSSGRSRFAAGRSSESTVSRDAEESIEIEMTSLDDLLGTESVDIMKIDVEGYELDVLLGGRELLNDPQRRPSAVLVELHPYAWENPGEVLEEITNVLSTANYRLTDSTGSTPTDLQAVDWLIATAT